MKLVLKVKLRPCLPSILTLYYYHHVRVNAKNSTWIFASVVLLLYHLSSLLVCLLFTVYNCIVPMGFLPWEIRVALPGES